MFKSKEEALQISKRIMRMITKDPPFSENAKIMRLHRRYVLVCTEYFVLGLMHDIIEFAGEDAAAVILYRGGFNGGRELFKRYYSFAKDKDMALDMCISSAWYFGWGIASYYAEQKDGKLIGHARIYDSFEAEEYLTTNIKNIKPGKKCNFFRGMVAGIMTGYAGKLYDAEEVKCKADGDEYCEFIIKPKKR